MMTIDEFLILCKSTKHNHIWLPINGDYNYICKKCEIKSYIGYGGPSCISDEEAIIKNLLE